MELSDLKSNKGAHKRRKRKGRGPGSGHGKTSGKGHKGQKSRSGDRIFPGFEGGQMPLIRRVPKRGFTGKSKKNFQIVNLMSLNIFESGSLVTPEKLKEAGLIKKKSPYVKILGDGDFTKPLVVKVHGVTKNAAKKIVNAGGKVEVLC